MSQLTTTKTASGVGMFAAIAASLCCIAPVLALVAGASGAASSLSWLEPARPFFIGLAVVTLSYAWYKSLLSKKTDVCGPDGVCLVEKKSFLASRSFLVIITIAAFVLMAFPYYAKVFYPSPSKQNVVIVESNNIQKASFTIKGMTCQGCEAEVNNELYKVAGVIETETDYAKGTSIVKFDKSKASVDQLQKAIAHTGYKVTHFELLNK